MDYMEFTVYDQILCQASIQYSTNVIRIKSTKMSVLVYSTVYTTYMYLHLVSSGQWTYMHTQVSSDKCQTQMDIFPGYNKRAL